MVLALHDFEGSSFVICRTLKAEHVTLSGLETFGTRIRDLGFKDCGSGVRGVDQSIKQSLRARNK